jgi:hypothetical protein
MFVLAKKRNEEEVNVLVYLGHKEKQTAVSNNVLPPCNVLVAVFCSLRPTETMFTDAR